MKPGDIVTGMKGGRRWTATVALSGKLVNKAWEDEPGTLTPRGLVADAWDPEPLPGEPGYVEP